MGQSIPSLAAVEFLLLPYVKELSVKQPAGLDYASTSQLEHPTDTWRKLTIVTIALAPGGTALVSKGYCKICLYQHVAYQEASVNSKSCNYFHLGKRGNTSPVT